MRRPIPGYRFFECYECGNQWKQKTRDCKSPSNETCHNYGEHPHGIPIDVPPYDYEIDGNLETDHSGNLK